VVLAWFSSRVADIVGIVIVGGLLWRYVRWIDRHDPYAGKNKPVTPASVQPAGVDGKPVGVWLGRDEHGTGCWSRAQRAVLVIGPPRSGKTSGVIIPTVSAHRGPVVVTSTNPDVLSATRNAREASGTVW
jgi:type IV secretory pathway TraG/TraD family ATPase VirD4